MTQYPEEWNDSLSGDFLWSNVNFGEAVTEPMTPLAWSVLDFSLKDWRFLPRYSTVGNIGGRPYLNISVFASLFKALGRSRQDLLKSMESTLYMRLPEELDIPLIKVSRSELLFNLPQLARTRIRQMQGLQRLPAYIKNNTIWFQESKEQLCQVETPMELYSLWQGEIKPHFLDGVWTVLGTASYSSDYTQRLRDTLEERVGAEDAIQLISNLSSSTDLGINELLPSLGPLIGLSMLAEGKITRQDYLLNFGHRGPHEFEISHPRPVEDQEWIDQQLSSFQSSSIDIEILISQNQTLFDSTWRRFLACYPKDAKKFSNHLKESARRARLREMARSEYVRDRWMVRLFALRAGELLSLGQVVFFLNLEELLDLLSGSDQTIDISMAIRSAAEREQRYRRFLALPNYPSLILGAFDPFQWANDLHKRTDLYISQTHLTTLHSLSDEVNIIKGSPGSAGAVEGLVRVILNPSEGDQLQKGEILVAVQTDIAWTLLFPRAAAVVTDVGAPLSHAAIVARELGIPAVVGCGNATILLKSGNRLRVDGGRGTVEILEQ